MPWLKTVGCGGSSLHEQHLELVFAPHPSSSDNRPVVRKGQFVSAVCGTNGAVTHALGPKFAIPSQAKKRVEVTKEAWVKLPSSDVLSIRLRFLDEVQTAGHRRQVQIPDYDDDHGG